MRGTLERIVKHRKPLKSLRTTWNTMNTQGVLMRGCLGKDCKASETLTIIEHNKKYYDNVRFMNTGMLGKHFERIGNLWKTLKITRTTMKQYGLLMREWLGQFWKAWQTYEKHWKSQEILQMQGLLMRGCLGKLESMASLWKTLTITRTTMKNNVY